MFLGLYLSRSRCKRIRASKPSVSIKSQSTSSLNDLNTSLISRTDFAADIISANVLTVVVPVNGEPSVPVLDALVEALS